MTKEIKRISWGLFAASALQVFSLSVIMSLAAYLFTDIMGISAEMTATCMFISTALGVVISCVSGAIVQKTRSKMGQYRFWLLTGGIIMFVASLIVYINTGSMILTAIIVTIGYQASNSVMDFIGTSTYALEMKMSGDSTEARTLVHSRSYAGSNFGYIAVGYLLIPMTMFFGKNSEKTGYFMTSVIFAIIGFIGVLVWLKVTKKYDLSNVDVAGEDEGAAENVSFFEMVKGVIGNRPGAMCVLSDITRFTGYYVQYTLMAYQCEYVIGDMMVLSYFLSATSFTAFLGNLLAPFVTEKMGGRKRTTYIFSIITGLLFAAGGIFGKTAMGFLIPNVLAYFSMSFLDSIDIVMYSDAGEYYLNRTGKDTRTYLLSMYSLANKIAMSLSTVMLGVVLRMIHYTPGMELTAHEATLLTRATGFSPAVGYLIPILLLVIHGVSDDEMTRCIQENASMYGEPEEA